MSEVFKELTRLRLGCSLNTIEDTPWREKTKKTSEETLLLYYTLKWLYSKRLAYLLIKESRNYKTADLLDLHSSSV